MGIDFGKTLMIIIMIYELQRNKNILIAVQAENENVLQQGGRGWNKS